MNPDFLKAFAGTGRRPIITIMKKVFFYFALGTLFLAPPGGFAGGPAPRELKVGVVVSEGYKSLPNWKADFERRLAYASRIFESEFKIKFTPAIFVDWKIPEEAQPMGALLDDLMGRFVLKDVDLIIGLTRLEEIPGPLGMRDLHVLGQTRAFSGYLVIRYPHHKLFKVQEETVLTHELGHLFGATHTADSDTIMAPVVDRNIPSRFDNENRQIILQTRDLDFRKGPAALKSGALQLLTGTYNKLVATDQSADFFYALGIFYLHLNQPDKTAQAWRKALAADPKSPQIYYDLGVLLAKMGQKADARKYLERAAALFNQPGQRAKKAEALKILGQIYSESNDGAQAHQAWTRAAALDPSDPDSKMALAISRMKNGQYQEAIPMFEKVLKAEPGNLKALTNLGLAYVQSGRAEEGDKILKSALESARQAGDKALVAEIQYHLAKAAMNRGDAGGALSNLQDACNLDPTVECHKKLGEFYFQAGRWDECIAEFAGVLQADPKDVDAYGILGTAFIQKGDVENGIGVFREALRHTEDPKKTSQLHKNIAYTLLNHRHFDMAIAEFRMAIAKDWGSAESHFGLAMAFLGNQDPANARDSLKQVLQLDPSNQKARETLRNIESNLNLQS